MQTVHNDRNMDADQRMTMERCLTSNFLLKFGMDYFGKRDLLYIDMRGDEDVMRMYDNGVLPMAPKASAAAADDEGAGDEDE